MVEVRPFDSHMGAEIAVVDLSLPLDDAAFGAIERALNERLFVVVPRQTLTPAQFVAFARRFGRPDPHVIARFHHPDDPNILVLSNVKLDGAPIGLEDAGSYFHTDYSYLDTPARCTLLYAIQIPPSAGAGGGTEFANQRLAWEELDARERDRIDGLIARHHYGNRHDLDETSRTAASPLNAEEMAKVHWVRHPLVREHPHSGRKTLYAVSGTSFGVENLEDGEARVLLDRLARHSTQPRYRFRRPYAVGDVVVWDNCSLLHSAPLMAPGQARTLWRVTVMDKGPTLPPG